MGSSCLRLGCLWISHLARDSADWFLVFMVVSCLTGTSHRPEEGWLLALAWFVGPFLLVGPLSGFLADRWPRQRLLAGAAVSNLMVVGLIGVLAESWWLCLALVGSGSAISRTVQDSWLPAAAKEARMAFSRVVSAFATGTLAAAVAGIGLAMTLPFTFGPVRAMAAFLVLNLVALLAILSAVNFGKVTPKAVYQLPGTSFYQACSQLFKDEQALIPTLALALFRALILAGTGIVLVATYGTQVAPKQLAFFSFLIPATMGAVLGMWLAGLQEHSRRILGLVPPAATGFMAALGWTALKWNSPAGPGWAPGLLLGLTGGFIHVPLRTVSLAEGLSKIGGHAPALISWAAYLATGLLAGLLVILFRAGLVVNTQAQLALLSALAGIGAMAAWPAFLREAVEQAVELSLSPFYRIHAQGPGLERFPQFGPVMFIANHAAWFDPLWMVKVLPRPVIPVMTSLFYDRPLIHWLMVHVVGAIRLTDSYYRREAPELEQALKVLDRGEPLLIFPEGWLKRREDQPLRLFGQGVWLLLKQRPHTPVVACWVEGGWGSFTSHWKGPPTVNKGLDWWRRIDIALGEPQILDPALLADKLATRHYLMNACLEARTLLGLKPMQTMSAARSEWVEKRNEA